MNNVSLLEFAVFFTFSYAYQVAQAGSNMKPSYSYIFVFE